MKRVWIVALYLVGAIAGAPSGAVAASLGDPQTKSNNYRIDESTVGGSGDYGSQSTNYKSLGGDDGGSSLGDITVGNSASSNYQVNSGTNTTSTPALTFIVNTSSVDLGDLSLSSAKTATATFEVINYTSYGYNVTMIGSAPSHGGHSLTNLTTDTASQNGVEQFGINTVANTSPEAVGGNPVNDVSGATTFGYGRAGAGPDTPYAKADQFRYVSADPNPVASAPKSSGRTIYTMTFMANISELTPGGKYTGDMTLVATGTY